MSYGYPTSRRFSRSLQEAFPCERWPVVEHYRSPRYYTTAGVLLAIFVGVAVTLAVIYGGR